MKTNRPHFLFKTSAKKLSCLLVFGTLFFLQNGHAQLIPAGVSISGKVPFQYIKVTSPPAGITTFEKEGIKLIIPPGWKSINTDLTDHRGLRHPNMVSLTNGEGGFAWFWYDTSVKTDLSRYMEDDLCMFAPLHEEIKTIWIKDDGPEVKIYGWKAYHIFKGARREFNVFSGYRETRVFKPDEAFPRFFCINYSLSNPDKFESDIIKMAEHLNVCPQVGTPNITILPPGIEINIDAAVEEALKRSGLEADSKLNKESSEKLKNNVQDVMNSLYGLGGWSLDWTTNIKKVQESPSLWQVRTPATNMTRIEDISLISPNYLLLNYSQAIIAIINTHTHLLQWYYEAPRNHNCYFVAGDEKTVIIRKTSNPDTLQAFETISGKEKWASQLKWGEPQRCSIFKPVGILVGEYLKNQEMHLTALKLSTGEKSWEINRKYDKKESPFSVQIGDTLIMFCNGIEAISADKGLTIWKNASVQLNDKCPAPEITTNVINCIDQNNILHVLDLKTGVSKYDIKLKSLAEYTSIIPYKERIYLRGMNKNNDKTWNYFIDALNSKNGENLWSYSDSVPTISNLIDNGTRIYIATWKGPMALKRDSGKQIFETGVSEVGRTYPVTIIDYNDTIIYIGEMVIAGVEGSSGRIIYRDSFDPVCQEAHFDGIDLQSLRLANYLKHFGLVGKQATSIDIPDFTNYIAFQSESSQNLANSYFQKSQESYSSGDRSMSDMYFNAGLRESRYAKTQSQLALLSATVSLAMESVKKSTIEMIDVEKDRFERMRNIRMRLEALYETQQVGNYAVRTYDENKSCDFEIIHLPTGSIIHKQKIIKDRALQENEWRQYIVIDPINNSYYYHELRMVPGNENLSENTDKLIPHAVYLVAISLDLNK
jgi:outer membrane protein assembly factor BamB